MKSAQKVIKYLALAFGVFLAVSIISGIISAAFGLFNLFGFLSGEQSTKDFSESFDHVLELDVLNYAGEVKIISGDKVTVEAENISDEFSCTLNGSKLVIDNDNKVFLNFFGKTGKSNSVITISLPKRAELNSIKVENGAGKVYVESVLTKSFSLDTGAGAADIDFLQADKADIDVGVGSLSIKGAVLGELDLDVGVGEFSMSGELNGNGKINGGVGKIRLDLTNEPSDHSFDVSTGIGSVKINGQKLSDGETGGVGAKGEIKVDGGIGEIIINHRGN